MERFWVQALVMLSAHCENQLLLIIPNSDRSNKCSSKRKNRDGLELAYSTPKGALQDKPVTVHYTNLVALGILW